MKKVCLCLLSALLTSICLTAQTLGTAPNGVFTAADIEYWVGTGSNEAALVLVFNDGKTPQALVWGYRYDGSKSMKQMCEDIAAADPRFYFQEGSGGFVTGFGIDMNGNGVFTLQNPDNPSQVVNPTTNSISSSIDLEGFTPVEPEDRWQCGWGSVGFWYLTNNGFNNSAAGWTCASFTSYGGGGGVNQTNATYASVPDPNSSCPSLKGFGTTTVSQNVASVIWNASTAALDYRIELKPASQADWTGAESDNVSDTFYTFTGLTSNTLYNCRVKAICGSDDESAWSSLSFRTPCDAVTELPYTDNFDSYGTGTSIFPPCWTKILNNTTASNALYVASTQHLSGTAALVFQAPNATAEVIAVAPQLDESINLRDLNVVFQLKYPQLDNGMIVGVVENDGTFVGIDTVYNTISNTWQRREVSLASYTGQGGRIALKEHFVRASGNMWVDDLSIDYIPACQTLSNQHLTEILHNEATIEWNDPNDAGDYLLEVSTSASDWSGALTFTSTTTNCTATGLTPNTWYTYRVKAICGSSDESAWAEGRFKTACGAIDELPYAENFDSYYYGDDEYVECWTKYGIGTSDKISISNSSSASGNRCLYLYSNRANGYTATVVLPSFEESLDLLSVQFKLKNPALPNGIMVGVLEGDNFVAIDTVLSNASDVWEQKEVSLASYGGEGGKIAFRVYSNTTHLNSFALYLDDVKVDYAPACPRPQNLVVTEGTVATTVDLTWTDEDNSRWVVYYKAADEEEYTMEASSANTISISNLSLQTSYTFQVASICSNGDTVKAIAAVNYSTPCYESAIGEFPFIESFENGIDCWTSISSTTEANNKWQVVTSGSNPSCSPHDGSKMLFFNSYNVQNNKWTAIISPAMNFPRNMDVSFDMFHNSSNNSYQDRVLLYVNDQPTLENATLIDSVLRYRSSNGWQEHSFSLPASTTGTQYIIIKAVSAYGSNIFLDNLKVKLGPTCIAVEDLSAIATAENATVAWVDPRNVGNYAIELSTTASDWSEATSHTSADTTYTFTNLTPNTTYHYRVKAVCSSTDESAWAEGSFKTACVPVAELPYTENFDSYSYGDDVYADCWDKSGMGTDDKINVSSSSPASGSRCLYFKSQRANACSATALLPSFEEDLTLLSLQFKFKNPNSYNGIIVGVSEADTLISIDTVYATRQGIWEQKEVSFASYEGEGGRITLKPYSTSSQSSSCILYVDDIEVNYSPACSRPEGLAIARGTEATSVDLSWTDEDNSRWVVYYKASEEEEYTMADFTDNSGSISGLEYATSYTFGVASICSNGDTVRAFSTVEYVTPMMAENVPYTCSFDSADATAWLLKNSTNTNKWHIGTPNGETTGALYISKDGGDTAGYKDNSASIVIAEKLFNTGTGDSLTISFDLTVGGEGSYDYLKVYWVPVDTVYNAVNTSTVPYYAATNYGNVLMKNNSNNYINLLTGTQTKSVTIANEPNTLRKLVFVWRNDGSSGRQPGAIIANLSIQPTGETPEPAPCDAPTALAVSNITETSAEVSWTGTATSYEVRLNGEEAETVSTTSKTFTDLTTGTAYTVDVRAVCEDNQSAWVRISFTTQNEQGITAPTVTTLAATNITHEAATLNGTITAGSEEITAQGFKYKAATATDWTTVSATGETIAATVNNLTAETAYEYKAFATTASGTVEGTVMNFTTAAVPVVAPTVTTLAATDVTYEAATLNGTITAGSEEITTQGFMYKAAAATDWTTVSATGTTLTATIDNLTAETAYEYKAFATTASGTVEGTVMNFTTAAVPVVAPTVTTLAATDVTYEAATLNGTITAGSEEITAQGFKYKASTATEWTTVSATGENIAATVNNLTAETAYEYKAFATTASGTVEGEVMNFTTVAAPVVAPTVTTLAATGITHETATLNGTISAGSETITAQGFEYKAEGVENWSSVEANGENMSATLSDLEASTTYEFRAFATTESGNTYGETMTFTTLSASGLEQIESGLSAIVYPNPAKDKATLSLKGLKANATITISDLQGRIILSDKLQAGVESHEIDTSGFESGVYYIRVISGNNVNTQKLIVE